MVRCDCPYPPPHLNLTRSPCATNSEFALEENLFSERRCLSLRIILQISPRHALKCCLVVALSHTTYLPTLLLARSLARRAACHGLARSGLQTALWAAWLITKSTNTVDKVPRSRPSLRLRVVMRRCWRRRTSGIQMISTLTQTPNMATSSGPQSSTICHFTCRRGFGKRRLSARISETISFFSFWVKYHGFRKFKENVEAWIITSLPSKLLKRF